MAELSFAWFREHERLVIGILLVAAIVISTLLILSAWPQPLPLTSPVVVRP